MSPRSTLARYLAAGLGTQLVLACASTGTTGPDQPIGPTIGPAVAVTVNVADRRQRVDGFGSTTLSLVYPTSGDNLGPNRGAAIEAAYGNVGLSVGLLSVGLVETPANATDPWNERQNDNADPTVFNWDGFNFTDSDEMDQDILQLARPYGYADVTLGPLLNVRNTLAWLQPIRDSDYARYLKEAAEHVAAIVRHWTEAYGLRPRLLELFNEPTSGNVELASSSTQEVVDLVTAAGTRLAADGFGDIRFLVPNEESPSRSLQVATAILADTAARKYVGAIGYHPYPYGSAYASVQRILDESGQGAPDPDAVRDMKALRQLAAQYDLPLWMTEVTEGPGNASYPFGSMETLLARAIHIHDNFLYAGASAFFGMQTIWDSKTHADHFAGRDIPFLSAQSGAVLVDDATGDILTTGMGYAIGQYARWVAPGSVVIGSSTDDPRILTSAFLSPSGDRVIVVAVNTRTDAKSLAVTINGATVSGSVLGERSYANMRWEGISAPNVGSDGTLRFDVPARSVVTIAVPVG